MQGPTSFVNTYERMDEARKYQDVSFISIGRLL